MPRDRRAKSPENSKHPMMTRSRSRDNPQNSVVFAVLPNRVEGRTTRKKNNKMTEKEKTAAIAPSRKKSGRERKEILAPTTATTKTTTTKLQKWRVMLKHLSPDGTNSPIRHSLSPNPSHRSLRNLSVPRIREIPATPGAAGASETHVEDRNDGEHDENALPPPPQRPRSSVSSIEEIPATPGVAGASKKYVEDKNVEEHVENAAEYSDIESPRAVSEASTESETDFEDEPAVHHQQNKDLEKTIIRPIDRIIWNQIKSGLNQECESTEDFKESISVYNKAASVRGFDGLNHYLSSMCSPRMRDIFFHKFRDDVTRLALQYSSLLNLEPIVILKRDETSTTSLRRRQIACILANAFLCTLPDDWGCAPINFSELFEAFDDEDVDKNEIVAQKLWCTVKYFSYIGEDDPDDPVTFQRLKLTFDGKLRWKSINKNFESIEVKNKQELVDQVSLRIILAHDAIGGGVFNFSANAEEINFLEHPELLVLRLCAEPLNNDEALFISGVKNYCECRGSGKSLRFSKEGGRTAKEMLVVRWGGFDSPLSTAKFIEEVEKIDSALNSIPRDLFQRLKVIEVGLVGDEYHELQFLIMAMIARKNSLRLNFCSHENRLKHQNVRYLRTILLDSGVDVGTVYKALLKYTELELKDNLGYWLASQLLYDESE